MSKEGDKMGKDWQGQNSEEDAEHYPTNRAGMPEDIADATIYLMNLDSLRDRT